ncbi:sensor histidine kinase [Actinomadura rubrisoli]|uniref:sensor histidine kinase n=1 Tax=Actinomadura rubrisoli TaxID=2530368 RepID=UPI001FB82A82|nr:histidine kinase [Actinomadura rubrisoli]
MSRAALVWRPSAAPPRLSRWAWTADAVLAVLLAAATVTGTLDGPDGAEPALPTVSGVPSAPPPLPEPSKLTVPLDLGGAELACYLLLAVMSALPLLVRRRYPLAALAAVVAAALAYHLGPALDPMFTFVSCVVAAYSAVMYSPYRLPAAAGAAAAALLLVADHETRVPELQSDLMVLLALIPIGLAANAIHTWKQRVRELEASARLAVERERSRIAQELHDVVTHNVSVMVVQAGAARLMLREAPDKAETALLAVESGGRAAMTELRHVMDLLTMDGDAADLAPRPTLDQAGELVDRVRSAGVSVELSVTGTPVPLPEGVDLTAYRVVQESLTNAVKHAEGAEVKVLIEHHPRTLRLEVTDTGGTVAPASHRGSGRGLIGLRERVVLFGGTLETGRRPSGGYRVRATLPLEDAKRGAVA